MTDRTSTWILITIFLVGMFAIGPGVALAGDFPTLIFSESAEVEASPGETIDLPILVSSDGATPHDDVNSVEVVITYDPAILNATDITEYNWFGQRHAESISTETTLDNEAGQIIILQEHTDPENGSTGFANEIAAIEFEIAVDASDENTSVDFADSSAYSTDGYPIPVMNRPTTIHIQSSTIGGLEPVWVGIIVVGLGVVLIIGSIIGVRIRQN